MDLSEPRLRNVDKTPPAYPLGHFPPGFEIKLAQEIVYLVATRKNPSLEGKEWEEIFAHAIDGEWKPSNVGLDDVVKGQTAWGAKSVKHRSPATAKRVRLISGRNSPVYSYQVENIGPHCDPVSLGSQVVNIWNERVSSVRQRFKHVRTVVLVKSDDLRELAVFEFETIRYEPQRYHWSWNSRGNLEGRASDDSIKFTWQPHGSQFTIHEDVPKSRLALRIDQIPTLKRDMVLAAIRFDPSWITRV